jgi:hypothetical protein
VVALLIVSSNAAFAQVHTASVSGRVEDSSGAAIPGATATLTNLETGAARTVSTDGAGTYRALSLPVGPYEIRVERPGFETRIQSGINLVVGQQAVINFNMTVGQVQQEVTVTGEAPLVNTTTSSVAGLVGEKQVKDLPLNGRSFDLLITLNPGAINYSSLKSDPSSGAGEGNYFSVAGRRPTENLFLLNGVEYTGVSIVGITPGGVSGQLLGIDAVREFNVLSSSYSAEYGKRAGAQVSVVTQSGTNGLHGSMFEFLRNSKLDARNFYDKGDIAAFKRNQFGGSLGGPLRKDVAFVFGSYEGFRQRLGISSVSTVPDQNARKGLLPDANGVPTPVPNLNPAMLPFFSLWPEPNGENLGRGFALSYGNPAQQIREDFGTVRFDQAISRNDNLAVSYTVDDGFNLTPQPDPLFAGIVTLRSQVLSVGETRVFSPRVINTFTAGLSHAGFTYSSPPLKSYPESLSFVLGKPPGSVIIGAGSTTNAAAITPAGAANNPFNYFYRSLFTYQDGLQVIRGKHQISMGVWFQRIRSNDYSPARSWGQASFATLETFMQGTVGTFTVAPNGLPMGWRSWLGAWYVQDSIQLKQNLNVSLGFRHEFTNGWNEVHDRASNFMYDSAGILVTQPRVASSPFTENKAKWLFGPRASLAWDPFGSGKTSIRAGGGIFYNLFDTSIYLLNSTPPFNGNASYSNAPLLSLLPFRPGTAFPPACDTGVPKPCTTYSPSGFQPTFETPLVESWNFTIEQQIHHDLALRVGYVGSFGIHQFVSADTNSIHLLTCFNPAGCVSGGVNALTGRVAQGARYIPVGGRANPNLASAIEYLSEGNSSYHALQLDLTRRFSRGLQFRANYTWAKNLDNGSALAASQNQNGPGQIMSPYEVRLDWGLASHNVEHQASGNISYELPIGNGKAWLGGVTGVADKLLSGWQVNGIVSLLSGFPVTPQIGSNWSGDGNIRSADRPNANPSFTGKRIIGKPEQWFDPTAYVLPIPGTYGSVSKSSIIGPGLAEADFSLFKNTKLTERMGLQFRSEFFNFTNRTNFSFPPEFCLPVPLTVRRQDVLPRRQQLRDKFNLV